MGIVGEKVKGKGGLMQRRGEGAEKQDGGGRGECEWKGKQERSGLWVIINAHSRSKVRIVHELH